LQRFVDEDGMLVTVYEDLDNDGFGNPNVSQFDCDTIPPVGFVNNDDDCDDTNAAINPDATEIINNLDDDCNGIVDDVPCTNAPAKPGAITGPIHGVCAGSQNIVYSIAPVNGATSYVWMIPVNSVVVSGQGTSTLTLNFTESFVSGTLKVQSQNACGISAVRKITINSIPVVASIQGTAGGYCGGASNVVFSVAANSGATDYLWTVPSGITLVSGQGTNSITVDIDANFSSGSLSVTASNACGSKSKSKTITAKPSTPSTITGQKNPCIGATVIYSVGTVPGANSYYWTVPSGWAISSGQGTIAVTVLVGSDAGKIKVTASNECGTSAERKKAVTPVSCKTGEENDKFSEQNQDSEAIPELVSSANVYPNPSFGEFNLTLTGEEEAISYFEVHDLAGNMIYHSHIQIMIGENNYRFDLTEFAAGVYLLNVNYGTQIETLKLIRQ